MNLHFYPSPFTAESRMLKELNSIVELGLADEAVVLGICRNGLEQNAAIGQRQRLIRLKFRLAPLLHGKIAKLVEYGEYVIGALNIGRKLRPEVINCHSLNVLPVGVVLKTMGRVQHLIYDAHELETERETLRGMAKWASKKLERLLIKHVDHVIVVSQPIADWYASAYPGTKVSVVRNIPKRQPTIQKSDLFRQLFDIPAGDRICVYQGILSDKRGVTALLDAFADINNTWHIVFMGFGPSEAAIKDASSRHPNIHFHPAVEPPDIIRFTSSADVGIFFLTHTPGLSYRFCLPNKFFEYLYGSCPVIVSSSLDHLSDLVTEHNIGWAIEPDAAALMLQLNQIDGAMLEKFKHNCEVYVSRNSWEDDEHNLVSAYARDELVKQ